MKNNTATFRNSGCTRASLLLITLGVLVGLQPGRSIAADAPPVQWDKYHDVKQHFTMEYPKGWTLHVDMNTIQAQSPDHASTALVEIIHPPVGQSAEDYVNTVPASHTALFPNATMGNVRQREGQTNQVIGTLTYGPAQGPGEAHVLCSLGPDGGILFVIASPADQFKAQSPTLVHILKSVQMDPASSGSAAGPGPQLTFIRWNEPLQHAFHVDLPRGWTVNGGEFKVGVENRNAYTLLSPGKDMLLQVGDESLPAFTVPTPRLQQVFPYPEGVPFSNGPGHQTMFLHYMKAPEFNRWYYEHALAKLIGNLQITSENEMTELEQSINKGYHSSHPNESLEATVAELDFTGVDNTTGRPLSGILKSQVGGSAFGANPNVATWSATPIVLVCAADDRLPARQRILLDVYLRTETTFAMEPAWLEQQARQQKQDMAKFQAQLKQQQAAQAWAAAHRSVVAQSNPVLRSRWGRGAASNDDFNRKFLNYIGDHADVTNPQTGETTSVSSGFSHYYGDANGGITGSNSASGAGAGLTELEEH